MDLKSKTINYNIELSEGETIKILVDDVIKFNSTVAPGFNTKVKFNYFEYKEEEVT